MPGAYEFGHFGVFPRNLASLDAEDLEQAVVAYLESDEIISAIVVGRIYPTNRPRTSVLPDLTYQFILGQGTHHLQGYSGISEAKIRLTARSRMLSDCARLRETIRQLDGFRNGYLGSVRVYSIRFEDVEDNYESAVQGSDLGTYVRQFDLNFRYRETVPEPL